MKQGLYLFLLILFISSCKGDDPSSINDQLLDPRVAVAKEFVDHLKKNERFYVLTLVQSYDPGNDNEFKRFCDDKYAKVVPYLSRYKLMPINKWFIALDTAHARTTDFFLCYKNIIIPFEKYSESNDPAFLQITFNGKNNSDKVIDFHIILREDCSDDGNVVNLKHGFTDGQDALLNQ